MCPGYPLNLLIEEEDSYSLDMPLSLPSYSNHYFIFPPTDTQILRFEV